MYKVIGSDQKIYGPVSVAQIRQWQAEGRINSATLLQAEGSNEWKPLSSIPEFGTPPVVAMPPVAEVKQDNRMAKAGLILGVLANVCCCLGGVCAILGIIFSAIALSRDEAHPQGGNKGVALAGLILSVVGLLWRLFVPLAFLGLPFNHSMWMNHWRHW
jgi:hypothetical protein